MLAVLGRETVIREAKSLVLTVHPCRPHHCWKNPAFLDSSIESPAGGSHILLPLTFCPKHTNKPSKACGQDGSGGLQFLIEISAIEGESRELGQQHPPQGNQSLGTGQRQIRMGPGALQHKQPRASATTGQGRRHPRVPPSPPIVLGSLCSGMGLRRHPSLEHGDCQLYLVRQTTFLGYLLQVCRNQVHH